MVVDNDGRGVLVMVVDNDANRGVLVMVADNDGGPTHAALVVSIAVTLLMF